jgi:hypothetical protein
MTKTRALADEANAPDLPDLLPLAALDRRRRASLLRAMSTIMPRLEALDAQGRAEPDPNAPAGNAGRAKWAAYAESLGITVNQADTRADIRRAVDAHRSVPQTATQRMQSTADLIDLAADIEELFLAVATEPDRVREWARDLADTDLIRAFLAYSQGSQSGEAQRSTS